MGPLTIFSEGGIELDSLEISAGLENYWTSLAISATPSNKYLIVSSVVNGVPHLSLIKIIQSKDDVLKGKTISQYLEKKIKLKLVHSYSFKYEELPPDISSCFPTMCTTYSIKNKSRNIPIFTFFTCGIKKKMFCFTLFNDKLVMIKSVKIGSFGFNHYKTGTDKNGE